MRRKLCGSLLLVLGFILFADPGFARTASGALEPFWSDLVTTRTDPTTGAVTTTTSRFYRDSYGRTRLEQGDLVTITDPIAQTTTYLSPASRTYLSQSWVAAQGESDRATSADSFQKTQSALSDRTFEGWSTQGREYTIVIPANSSLGNTAAVTKHVRLWLSSSLKIPVRTEIDDPVNGASTQQYSTIVSGTEPAASLFQVPSGYTVQPPNGDPVIQRPCNLRIAPDPLILNSFGPILGRGTQSASTSANRGCAIVGWAAIWESPLTLRVLTPLGLPSFSVRWADNGGAVPFLPWVAVGDIAFVAANASDTTTKDALVILTVWF